MEEVEIYKNIGIKDFYLSLISKYNMQDKIPLEITDKNNILEICSSLNIKAKYFNKEKFFRLYINSSDESFINLILKYGYLQCGFYFVTKSKKLIGTTLNSMCLKLDLSYGSESTELLPNICISSYDEFRAVVILLVKKYDEFYQVTKKEFD